MSDTAIEFPVEPSRKRQSHASDTAFRLGGTESAAASTALGVRKTESKTRGAQALAPIDIDLLYPATTTTKSDLLKALGLLADGIGFLERARAETRTGNVLVADRFVQRFQRLLPDLFSARAIGDGFGVVVNSIHIAFINQHGRPLSLDQLTALWRVLKELRTRPYLTFDQALEYIEQIEDAELQVDPAILSELLSDNEHE